MPTFVMDPESVIVIVGDQVTIMCSAEATPFPPNITWWDGEGAEIIADEIFNISSSITEFRRTRMFSELYFSATDAENRTGNGSVFQCRATVQLDSINRTLTNDSEVANITIAGKDRPSLCTAYYAMYLYLSYLYKYVCNIIVHTYTRGVSHVFLCCVLLCDINSNLTLYITTAVFLQTL